MYLGKAQFQRCEGAVVKRVTHELMASREGYATNLSLMRFMCIIKQTHGQLVTLEKYGVRVILSHTERLAEMIQGGLRNNTGVSYSPTKALVHNT